MKNLLNKKNACWLVLIAGSYGLISLLISVGVINNVYLTVLMTIGINIILAISLNLIIGVTGQFSLGHAGFMIIGAYCAGVAVKQFSASLLYHDKHLNPMAFLKSETFLDLLIKICKEQYPYIAFADAFHTMRSMLLPVLYLMGSEVPEADVYHAICTGYGGLLACLGGYVYKKDVLLTEHGIYTREREEEIIRAKWVVPSFKKQWIAFFYMLSDMIYQRAFRVTCLFTNAMRTQIQMGCAPGKCRVIENGIDYDRLSGIPLKEEDGWVDIGAVVRLAPIKDIKTMIYAFFELSAHVKNVRLHIMGGVDDEEYAQECYELVKQLKLENIIFTGRVDIVKYMEKLDFTILTSISEGQPLSVLESFAARRPCVTTDVGCCRELLEGKEEDVYGKAGYYEIGRAHV